MGQEQRPIIIKKIKKKGHAGHHGGAWKVAYADFVTAMMAFFMVLWLLAVMSTEDTKAVSHYFRSYTIFSGEAAGGATGMSIMTGDTIQIASDSGEADAEPVSMAEAFTYNLSKNIEDNLEELKDQIAIFTTAEGIRLEIHELDKKPIFKVGNAELTERGKRALAIITDAINTVPNRISIEGHTDARPFPSKEYTNWELAADRANAARREMVRNGLSIKRVSKVTSFASNVMINLDDPYDDFNRRVSILIEKEKK